MKLKTIKVRSRLSLLLLSAFLIGMNVAGPVMAQLVAQQTQAARSRSHRPVRFKAPRAPERGAPGQRGQGASRGPCQPNEQPLTALVPTWETLIQRSPREQIRVSNVLGLTTQAQPTLWFYVPKAINVSAELVLQDAANKTLYRTRLAPPQQAGIVGVQLPSTAPALEPQKHYRWFFKVKSTCNPKQVPQLTYVEGWIQRITLDAGPRDRIQQSSPAERAALYAENGVWFDAVNAIAELRRANPTDTTLIEDWQTLLKSANLEALAGQAIAP